MSIHRKAKANKGLQNNVLYKDQSFDGNRPYNLAMFILTIVIQITVKIVMLLIEITQIVGDCQITHMVVQSNKMKE